MIKIYEYCNEGHKLELRKVEVREDEDNPKSEIVCWLLHGFCKECSKVFMMDIFKEKISPTEGIDYKIISERISDKEVKEGLET